MKFNSSIWFFMVLILFFLAPYTYSEELSPEGWRYPLDSDFRGSWEAITRVHPEPFHISSDFNDDGIIDHAWILISKEVSGWGLFVFLGKDGGTYEAIQLDDQTGNSSPLSMGVSLMGSNEYKTACGKGYWPCKSGEPEVLRIKKPAINYFQFEGANSFFYWDKRKQKFVRVWISD